MTSGWPRGTSLPDARSPNGIVAGLWKDLDPSRGGSIVWAVVGAPPERRFVVEFTDVPDRDRPAVLNTFQIVLAETSDEIVVRYNGASGNNLGAAAGVESESGSVGITWLIGGFVLDRAAVRYTPLILDSDGDGWIDCVDTCRLVPDFTQLDSDSDGTGDACELSTPPIVVGAGALAGSGNVEASRPDVAVDAAGNAIVVWDGPIDVDNPIDGDTRGIAGRWYDRQGVPRAAAFRVNTTTMHSQLAPRVVVGPNGEFTVAWGHAGADTSSVRMQRYASDDTPSGAEQILTDPVSTLTTILPGMAIDQEGAVSVAYGARYESPRRWPIEVQRFDATGALDSVRRGGTQQFRSAAGSTRSRHRRRRRPHRGLAERHGHHPRAALRCEWIPLHPRSGGRRRGGRRVPGSRPATGCQRQQRVPDLGCARRGRRDGCSCRASTMTGSVFPTPLMLETAVASAANNPAVAMAGPGVLLVVWEQDDRIVGQRLTVDGRALERPTILSTPSAAAASQAMPALATTSDGGTAVVWSNTAQSAIDIVLRQIRHCGNGNIDPGEQCDDGNAEAGDCCSPSCQFEPGGQTCDDGLLCTGSGACSEGACVPGPSVSCDDGNACTADRCDERTGLCVSDPTLLTGVVCDDGNACTQQDACGAGTCQGQPMVCDDGNACTADSCDPASGCQTTNLDGASCDDGDECSDDDVCSAGACRGTQVCGLPPEDGGGSGGSGDGTRATLQVLRKHVIKLRCEGHERGTCAATLYAEGTTAGTRGARLSKPVRRRLTTRGGRFITTLKLKLTSTGRATLDAAGDDLPALLDLTIAGRSGSTRMTEIRTTLHRR